MLNDIIMTSCLRREEIIIIVGTLYSIVELLCWKQWEQLVGQFIIYYLLLILYLSIAQLSGSDEAIFMQCFPKNKQTNKQL